MSSIKEIEDIDYSLPKLGKLKWLLLIVASIFLFFFISFPVKDVIDNKIKATLSSIPGCSLKYKSMNIEFFLPKILVRDISVPMSCLKKFGAPIKIKNLTLFWRGFNFAPFGPHFKIQTNLFTNDLTAFYTLGISSHAINMQDATIQLETLRTILPKIRMAGKLKINGLLKLNANELSDIKLTLQSKNLKLPSQEIMNIKLPHLNMNNLFIKADMITKNKVKISDLIIGDTESPIRANFKGSVKLNQKIYTSSNLDLDGEVAFSSFFLEKFAIIKLFMNKFTQKDDFYQLHFAGTISNPDVTSPKK